MPKPWIPCQASTDHGRGVTTVAGRQVCGGVQEDPGACGHGVVRSVPRDLLPDGWGDKERHTIVIRRHSDGTLYGGENHLFDARQLEQPHVHGAGALHSRRLRGRPAHVDVCQDRRRRPGTDGGRAPRQSLELSFDAEHTDTALERYVPHVVTTAAQLQLRDRALSGVRIFLNDGRSWHGIIHHHPATFDTLSMDRELKQSIIADLSNASWRWR
ncbi:hypothetical protein ACP4OV_029480 [Aristida adscensionis]